MGDRGDILEMRLIEDRCMEEKNLKTWNILTRQGRARAMQRVKQGSGISNMKDT